MSKAFKVIKSNDSEKTKFEYPQLPFVVKNVQGNYFIVCKDAITNKYRYVDLHTSTDTSGDITDVEFNSIEDMFERYPSDKIFNVELVIKDEYK
jgi:hypothetical protein